MMAAHAAASQAAVVVVVMATEHQEVVVIPMMLREEGHLTAHAMAPQEIMLQEISLQGKMDLEAEWPKVAQAEVLAPELAQVVTKNQAAVQSIASAVSIKTSFKTIL